MSAFEYVHRWPLLADRYPYIGVILEARDQQLESFLRSFSGCHSDFEYKHRWPQILPLDPVKIEELFETHMTELENEFFGSSYNCTFEFPYRAVQLIPLLVHADPLAAVLLNENDLVLESALNNCHCGGGG